MKFFHVLFVAALSLPLLIYAAPEKKALPGSLFSGKQLRTLMAGEPYPPGAVDTMLTSLPESEQKQVKALFDTDPAAAKAFIVKHMEAKTRAKSARSAAIRQAAAAVRSCQDPAEKEALISELRKLVKEDFDATSCDIEIQLKRQEARLQEVREGYQKRISNSDRMIDQRVKRLVNGRGKGRKERKVKDPDGTPGVTPKPEDAAK